MISFSLLVYAEEQSGITDAEVEKVAEEIVVKAAEEIVEKEEIKAQRPDKLWVPTQVRFLVFVIDIDEINDVKQNFMGNIYLRLRWKDERLANPEGTTRQLKIDEVWNPRIIFANQQGAITKSLPEVVQVEPDGTVIYHQRYTGKISQPLRIYNFPMDEHEFTIQFVAAGYKASEMEFIPDKAPSGIIGASMSDTLSLVLLYNSK